MRIDRMKIAVAIIAVGVLTILLNLVAGGVSGLFTPTAESSERLGEESKRGGQLYRPFVETQFDYVTFSGLYLSGEGEKPELWVMWGFGGDAVTCFYLKADGADIDGDGLFDENDAPQDEQQVSYILRAAQPSYSKHNSWALEQSIADTASYYDLTDQEVRSLFTDGVLEASRSGRVVSRAAWAAGIVLLIVGVAFAAMEWVRRGAVAQIEEEAEEMPEEQGEPWAEPEDLTVEELDAEALAAGGVEDEQDELDEPSEAVEQDGVDDELDEQDEQDEQDEEDRDV